jgi:serine O-acetyltransferase
MMSQEPVPPVAAVAPQGTAAPRVGFIETLRLIRGDHRRICQVLGGWNSVTRRIFWAVSPNVVALALYRLSHYLHAHHLRFLAWPVYLMNLYITHADIPPSTEIGANCFLGHVAGTIICGKVGSNAMLFGAPGIGGGMGHGGEGATANGLPELGDNVVVGARAMVLGPVRIGDGATIGAGAVVQKDMEPNSTAVPRPTTIVRTTTRAIDYDSIAGLK